MQACNLKRTICFAVLFSTFLTGESCALTEGGVGNAPLADPGWPKGAAQIFNHEGRIAYWVGPPLGGGQWYAECIGDRKYIAELKPAGGEKVGSWGGSSNVGSNNTVEFKGIPPGKYVLSVHPNPSTEVERRRSQTIELSGGEALKIVVKIDD